MLCCCIVLQISRMLWLKQLLFHRLQRLRLLQTLAAAGFLRKKFSRTRLTDAFSQRTFLPTTENGQFFFCCLSKGHALSTLNWRNCCLFPRAPPVLSLSPCSTSDFNSMDCWSAFSHAFTMCYPRSCCPFHRILWPLWAISVQCSNVKLS